MIVFLLCLRQKGISVHCWYMAPKTKSALPVCMYQSHLFLGFCFPSSITVTGSATGESDRVSCDMQVAAGRAETSPHFWGIPFLLFSALSGNHLTPCLSMPQLSTCFVLFFFFFFFHFFLLVGGFSFFVF